MFEAAIKKECDSKLQSLEKEMSFRKQSFLSLIEMLYGTSCGATSGKQEADHEVIHKPVTDVVANLL